ncbi:unnamed protein product [Heterobilharzia americana]|nr:unnamed protein product [Heterobilharzia americana]
MEEFGCTTEIDREAFHLESFNLLSKEPEYETITGGKYDQQQKFIGINHKRRLISKVVSNSLLKNNICLKDSLRITTFMQMLQ